MGEQPTFTSEAVDWSDIGYQITHGFLRRAAQSDIPKQVISTLVEKETVLQGILFDVLVELAVKLGEVLHKVEGPFLPVIAGFVAPTVQGLFGAEVSEATFARRMAAGNGAAAGQAIVEGLFRAITGDAAGGMPAPGDAGAKRIAGAAVAASLESTFNAIVPEIISDLLPEFGHFTAFTELPENIIRTLGVSRLVRRAVGPLVDATCTTPLQWSVNKRYPTQLLAPSTAARQIARGFGDRETWLEDLRRAGYDQARIEAVLNEQRRFFSAADVNEFVTRGYWDAERGAQHLRDQGYDDQGSHDALRLEGLRRIEQIEGQEANAIIAAYVAGDIDRGTFVSMLDAAVTIATERALYAELADVRRAANVKRLSLGQIEAMVKSGILNFIDYREAAARDGYEPDAVTALELQLRYEMDKATTIAEHRAQLEADRAAAAKVRADAAAAKKAELAAARALAARGKRADLERAAIRGLVPLDRVQELYAATFDADTVPILLQLLEGDRQAYLDEQQKRADALKKAGTRALGVGDLDQAVTRGTLTLPEYRTRLDQLGFGAADIDVLARTLQAKLDDAAAAKQAREEAIAAGKVKHVSVPTLEALVRRGHRTMADYDRTLQDLGFDDGARAAMRDLLQDQIDEDAKARAAREAAKAKADVHGLTLEQIRRGVLLGVVTLDKFQTYLVDNSYTPESQIVLVDELRADLAEADAARQRRAEAAAAKDSRDAPVSDVARAARLGLIPVQAYADRLDRAGYSQDARDLEMDLLVQEIADLADARAQKEAAEAAAQNRGISLAALERAVKAGLQPIGAYTSAARASGLSAEAADQLTALLQQEIDAAAAAEQRRANVAAAAAQKSLSLAQLEAAVKAGLLTLDDYAAQIADLGYGPDDVAILVALLGHQLAVLEEARSRRAAIAGGPPEPELALSTLEKAVKAGVLRMDSFLLELTSRGYGQGTGTEFDEAGRLVLSRGFEGPFDDTALLGLLLQTALDAAAAKGG